MEVETSSKTIVDQSTGEDSESEVERIFVGTPKQSETKFREVANLLHTVKPASKVTTTVLVPIDKCNSLNTPSSSPCREIVRSMTSQKLFSTPSTRLPDDSKGTTSSSGITCNRSDLRTSLTYLQYPNTVNEHVGDTSCIAGPSQIRASTFNRQTGINTTNKTSRGTSGNLRLATIVNTLESQDLKAGSNDEVAQGEINSSGSCPASPDVPSRFHPVAQSFHLDDTDKGGDARARKQSRRSPERLAEDRRKQRLLSLSPDSSTVLTGLFTPTTSRTAAEAIEQRGRNLFDSASRQVPGSLTSPWTIQTNTLLIGPGSPPARVPVSQGRPTFYANPLDNPNRSPARRVLASIASTSPISHSKAQRSRGGSCEPIASQRQTGINPFPRSRSAEPLIPKQLPHPISAANTLNSIIEETTPRSEFRINSRIPRPPSKPYSRPPNIQLPTSRLRADRERLPIKAQTDQVQTEKNLSSASEFPFITTRSVISNPHASVARIVVPGMFTKLTSGSSCQETANVEVRQTVELPSKTESEPLIDSGKIVNESRNSPIPSEKPVEKESYSSRSTRARRMKQISIPDPCFSDMPNAVKAAEPREPRRKTVTKRRATPIASALSMSDNALRALTGSNTLKNQKYVIELDERIIRKSGKRPQSPNTRLRTELERRDEAREVDRRARAERHQRRSGEAIPSPAQDMGDEESNSHEGKHRRGPGDEEDYETPHRDTSGRVKWDRELYCSSPLSSNKASVEDPVLSPPVLKSILSSTSKAASLDNFGNLPESEQPIPGLVAEKVVFTRYVYDDDPEVMDEAQLSLDKAPKRGGRKKKG